MTSGACTLMNATRSSVPFWISASRAVTVSKPSFSRAERMASITSSRELKIATRGADVRGTTAVVLSPLHAGHAQRVRASRGPDAAREEQGADASDGSTGEPTMHQRGAASLHLATGVAMLKLARHRSSRFDGAPTAIPQENDGPRRRRCQELKIYFIALIYQEVTSAVYGERRRQRPRCEAARLLVWIGGSSTPSIWAFSELRARPESPPRIPPQTTPTRV